MDRTCFSTLISTKSCDERAIGLRFVERTTHTSVPIGWITVSLWVTTAGLARTERMARSNLTNTWQVFECVLVSIRKGAELPEVLIRIPFLAVGPGIQASDAPHPAHITTADVMPTICEAIGTDIPQGVQGRSLWPLLTGQEYPEEEFDSAYAEHGFGGLHYTADDDYSAFMDGLNPAIGFDELNSWSQSGTMRMVRSGDWKLVFDMQEHGQLYNLAEDPVELNNLYDHPGYADIQSKMLAKLLGWTLRAQDPLPHPRRRYKHKSDSRNYWSPYR